MKITIVGKDWPKNVSLAVTEWQLDGLENIRHIRFLTQDSSDVEFSQYGAEDLRNMSAVSQLVMCVPQDALSQYGFMADQAHSLFEASVRHVVDIILSLDNQVLQFVLGNESW